MSIVKKQHRADSLLSSLLSRFVFMVTRAGGGRVSLWWTMTCFNMTQHHTYTMWLCSRLENDRFEHRTSDIGNIGLQAAHRTSDCYTAPIPIRRSTSLGGPACLLMLIVQLLNGRLCEAGERGVHLISVRDISYVRRQRSVR